MAAIAQTPASVILVSGSKQEGVAAAGVTIVAGNIVSYDSSTQTYKLADANVSGVKVAIGMALGGAGPGQPFFFALTGAVVNVGGTMTVAVPIYLSVTAGGITETYADIASAEWSVILGQALTANNLLLTLTGQAVAKP